MKKVVCLVLVLCLAPPVLAGTASLGYWNEGDPGTTHQSWDFTPGYIVPSGAGYTADPESFISPDEDGSGIVATISPVMAGSCIWDGMTMLMGDPGLFVALEIPNYETLNEYKIVWVDLGAAVPTGITVSAHDGGSVTFQYQILPGQGDAEFGVRIWPNPDYEKINFYVMAPLDYIHADTICTPEPATLAILGLGGLLLRRRVA
jgi:hypothetical protein